MTLLENIQRFLSSRHLREAQLDAALVLSPRDKAEAESKWKKFDTTTESQKKILRAAKKGDQAAINYTWLKMVPRINQTFWKSYLGPNAKIRQSRIQSDGWGDWIGVAYTTLVGGFKDYRDAKSALDRFDPERYTTGDLFQHFGFMYTQLLKNSSLDSNALESSVGMRGVGGIKGGKFADRVKVNEYDPAWQDAEQEKSTGYSDEVFDSLARKDDDAAFWKSWKQYAQDESLDEGRNGVTPGILFRAVLEHPTDGIPELVARFPAISRNTIQTYLDKAVALLGEYDITQQQLMSAIKDHGAEKLTSYLSEIPAAAPKAAAKIDQPDDEFMSKWASFCDDPRIWNSARDGWSAGPVIAEYVLDPKMDINALAREAHVAKSLMKWYLDRGFKLLRQKGINDADLKSAIKKYGGKKLASFIGDEE